MSGASVRSGIDPSSAAAAAAGGPGAGSSKVEAPVGQRAYPGFLTQQDLLKGLPAKHTYKQQSGRQQHFTSGPPLSQPQHTPAQGLHTKLTAVMGNNMGGSGDPTGQNPTPGLTPGQSAALQTAQIINMSTSSVAATSTSQLAQAVAAQQQQQQQSQPIHPVSIPTPVGIHTSGGTLVQPQPVAMASLIRSGLQSPQILHTTFQTHVPRGPAQISQLTTPRPGVLRPSQPGNVLPVTSAGGAVVAPSTPTGGLALHPTAIQPRVHPVRPNTPPVVNPVRTSGGSGSSSVASSTTAAHLHHHQQQQQQQDRTSVSVTPAATSVQITIQQQHGMRGGGTGPGEVRPVSAGAQRQPQASAKITVSQPPIAHNTGAKLAATANANKAAALSLAHLKSSQPGHKVMTTHAGSIAAALPKTKGTGYGNLAHTLNRPKIVVTQTAQQSLQQQQHHQLTQQHSTIIAATSKAGGGGLNLSQQTINRTQKVVIPQITMPGGNVSGLSMQAVAAASHPKTVGLSAAAASHLSAGHHLQHQQHHPSPHVTTTVTSTIGTIPIAKVTPQRQLPSQLHSSSSNEHHHLLSSSSIAATTTASSPMIASSASQPPHPHPSTLFPASASVSVSNTPRSSTTDNRGGGGGVGGIVVSSDSSIVASGPPPPRTIYSGGVTAAAAMAVTDGNYQFPPYHFLQYPPASNSAMRPGVAAALSAAVSNSQTPTLASIQQAAANALSQHSATVPRTANSAPSMPTPITPASAATAAANTAEQLIKVHHNSSVSAMDQQVSHHVPTPQPNTKASPLPSILRKRTHEGVMVVKKNLSGTIFNDMADLAVSHNVSPKGAGMLDPNREISQSSTDTASSAESHHQNSDLRVKMEPNDSIENGNAPLGFCLPNSIQSEASPRKKPRKQMFVPTTDDMHREAPSAEETMTAFAMSVQKLTRDRVKQEAQDEEPMEEEEYVDDNGIRYTRERIRPPITLTGHYKCNWKTRNNHFQRYSDVKPKEERKPTINELANLKGVQQKATGWKLYHVSAQMEDLVEEEMSILEDLKRTQEAIAPKNTAKTSSDDDLAMLHELSQANIQRCQLYIDNMKEARSQMLDILNHQPRILDIVNKHRSKRPVKKKER